ncbi:MAG: metal ABC transporter permease [Chloroflexaceae bacterium]|nr:metal ABC transporter permease [Chloroflexaceae bacterium]
MVPLFSEPLHYAFMVRGMMAAAMVGVVCAVVGSYVMLRGMAFFGDALAHAILPGVALGYLVSGGARGDVFWWALGTAMVASVVIGAVSQGSQVREDTAISIVFAAMFALGIGMISTMRGYAVDLAHFLFGNVLGVTTSDLWHMALLGGLVLLVTLALYKEFLVLSFDPVLAATLRLPVTLLNYVLLILIAITIVVSLQTVGIALTLAMLITPAATASLLTRRLPVMMFLGAAVGAFSGVTGLYLSYYLNVASGPSIVLVCTVGFVAALLVAPRRGWVWKRLRLRKG